MDRNVLLKIIGALPDDKLIQALSVIGLQPGDMGGFDPLQGMAADDGIQSWNDREVPYGGGQDRPTLSDKAWAAQPPNAQTPTPGGMLEGENPFLQTGGT